MFIYKFNKWFVLIIQYELVGFKYRWRNFPMNKILQVFISRLSVIFAGFSEKFYYILLCFKYTFRRKGVAKLPFHEGQTLMTGHIIPFGAKTDAALSLVSALVSAFVSSLKSIDWQPKTFPTSETNHSFWMSILNVSFFQERVSLWGRLLRWSLVLAIFEPLLV